MKATRRLVDRWVEQPPWDFLIAACAASLVVLVQPSDPLVADQRGTWLQTLVTVDAGLLGVAGIAVTLVFTVTPNDRLTRVTSSVGPKLSRLVLSGIGGLALGTVGFTSLFLIEHRSATTRLAAAAGVAAFSAARVARLWWLVRRITLVLAIPDDRSAGPPPQVPWTRPVLDEADYALGKRPPAAEATFGSDQD